MKIEALASTRPSALFTKPARSGAGVSAAETAPVNVSHAVHATLTAEAKAVEQARVFMGGKVPCGTGRFKCRTNQGRDSLNEWRLTRYAGARISDL